MSMEKERDEFIVYGRLDPPCAFCKAAKDLLELKGLPYVYEDVSNVDVMSFLAMKGWKTVPQIELWTAENEVTYIGGYNDLKEFLKTWKK